MNETVIKNPLTNWMKNSIVNSKERLNFAFPFLTSFALTLLDKQTTSKIADKRIITRFDDSSLSSFDLSTFKALLDLGFKVQYDNSIHLKLYIADNDVYITSSNFTRGGFEDNVELSVKIDSNNTQNCVDIFNEIWKNCSNNILSYDLINDNWSKYEILRKREKYAKKIIKVITKPVIVGKFDLQTIIDEIFNQKTEDSQKDKLVFEANKLREKTKTKLMRGFDPLIFYAPKDHKLRRENLFYNFVYGKESELAGTGLRELQFKTAFEHKDFEKVVNYFYPEMLGLKPWNLSDKDEFQTFCGRIFDFDIPYYSETLPIRLASYFYPDYFVPIFKLDDLKEACEILGLETDAETREDRLYVYNSFVADKMRALPFNNYVKQTCLYQLLYTVKLYNRINNGETYENVIGDYQKIWKKRFTEKGKDILTKLQIIGK